MRPVLIGTILIAGGSGLSLWSMDLAPIGGAPIISTSRHADAAEIDRLVGELRSPNYRNREAAGKALLSIGDRVLPQLKSLLKTERDQEAHRRLEMIVSSIENQRLITARKITFQAKDKTANEIVAEIEKQSGYALSYNGNNNPNQKFNFDWKDVPFWEALDQICDEAGLQANPNGNDGALNLYNNGSSYSPYVCYSGPFKIMASNINMSRNIQLANIPRNGMNIANGYNNLNFTVYSEPKVPLLSIGQATITKAVDEKGNSLVMPVDNNNQYSSRYYGGSYYRQFYQSFSINLSRPNQQAQMIKEIVGTVPVTMLSETRAEISINDILKVKEKKFVGRTIELDVKSTTYQNDVFTIELTASRRDSNQQDYNWAYSVTQRFQLLDEQNRPYQYNGVQNQQNGNNVVTVTLQYRQPYNRKIGKPAKFEFQEWFTITRDVDFRFKDIPLP
jgi:hypothetical protein